MTFTPESAPGHSAPDTHHAFARGSFAHLHTHTDHSLLDGVSTMEELVDAVVAQGGTAVAVTDHGTCSGHPELQSKARKAGIKPIFGIELYLVDDRHVRAKPLPEKPEEPKKTATQEERDAYELAVKEREEIEAYNATTKDYWHLTLWAMNNVGLKNLWALSTETNRSGFYYKPRADWELLEQFSEGLAASTACLRGPLVHHGLLDAERAPGSPEAARMRLGRLMEIFPDRLYVEIHANQLPQQVEVNPKLVELAREYQLPLLAAVDSHYALADDKDAHRVWLSIQTNSDVADETDLFGGGQDYHLMGEAEVRKALAYLGDDVVEESIANTMVLADACNAEIEILTEPPIFSKKGGHAADAERMADYCLDPKVWIPRVEGKREPQEVYFERFEREYRLLEEKQFCGYFLHVQRVVQWAKSQGILVGPGRGSGGGSLIAYLMGITEIDPVDADLMFERFLTKGRTALPDFDIDFPQSKKGIIQQFVIDTYGEDHVAVVGSIGHLKSKGIIKDLARALKSQLPEEAQGELLKANKIIEQAEAGTAGLGLPWDELWAQFEEELGPYREKYPGLFAYADKLVGRIKSYGQHAAGMVISPDRDLVRNLPLRRHDKGHMVTQFDKDVLEEMGYTKYDFLTLRNLDTIQAAIDLVYEKRGIRIWPYDWREEYEDPQVWEYLSDGHTLGVFQIETVSGTKLIKRMRPANLNHLADAGALVRPGPMRAGLTDQYLRRKHGEEDITFPDPRMAEFLTRTYGTIIYQEDVLRVCMVLCGYDDNKADEVRKILGKKKVEAAIEAGKEFRVEAVKRGMTEDAADRLWLQLEQFAKYSFGRAHSWGYAMLAYWTAWLMVHYAMEYITSALSTVDKERIPEFVNEARRIGFQVLPPDVNLSKEGFTCEGLVARYGLGSVKGVGGAGVEAILQGQPYTSWEDFLARKGSKANAGHIAILARVGTFDSLVPNRRGLETLLLEEKTGVSTQCVFKDPSFVNEHGLPCHFDWANEPIPINPRTGKKTKQKSVPKRCTKGCRQYQAPDPLDLTTVKPYTDEDIRDIERETLGVYLSSTPFDRLADEDRSMLLEQAEQLADPDALPGIYWLAGLITKVKSIVAKNGKAMAFVDIQTEGEKFDVTVFSDEWVKYQRDLATGKLVVVEVFRDNRGPKLRTLLPA